MEKQMFEKQKKKIINYAFLWFIHNMKYCEYLKLKIDTK